MQDLQEITPEVTKLTCLDDMAKMDVALLRRRFQRGRLPGDWKASKAGRYTVYCDGDWKIGCYGMIISKSTGRQFQSRITLTNKKLGFKVMLHNVKCADAIGQTDKAVKGVERQIEMLKKALGIKGNPILNFIG